ncbi:PEP-CTERM sorting domain-containing protein [Spirulina sp. 06S082]|uniref:PEP-CTERM sorting domain-containing protein n=1 Tax=Spirulina sp. 06S082 TaxID=3110248 RepID=UPI002B1F02C2|nr:PEP-CTERM sorting domain-containing protein [Spirulina sp. 06S082]MEA5472288.1 PEP-CTERM sorting domain-containing protein [Spirulina sp. 06S082]
MTVQSTLFSKITQAAIALPLVVAGMALNVGSAEAGGFAGSFQISNENVKLNLSSGYLDFVDSLYTNVNTMGIDDDLAEVEIVNGTGTFANYQSAFLKDLSMPLVGEVQSFIDLSTDKTYADRRSDWLDAGDFTAPIPLKGVADGNDTFNLTKITGFEYSDAGGISGSTSFNLFFDGMFLGNDYETTAGKGVLTFQVAGLTALEVESLLESDPEGKLTGLTFSGAAVTVEGVPEPATILGLLAISGLAGTSIRKRKAADA